VAPRDLSVVCGEEIGRDCREHEKTRRRLHDPEDLDEGAAEIIDLFDDISAPHEVEVGIGVRQFVHHPVVKGDSVRQACGLHGLLGSLDVQGDRLDTDAVNVEAADQLHQVSAVSTACVEHEVTSRHVGCGRIEQRVRASRI